MKDGRITQTKDHNHRPDLSWLKRLESLTHQVETRQSAPHQPQQVFDIQKIMDALPSIKDEVNQLLGNREYVISSLIKAASLGHASVVQLLLQGHDIDANLKDMTGFNALGWAALKGHSSVVKILLRQPGIDVNVPSDEGEGATPLFAAAQEGHDEVVELLLEHDDIDVKVPLSGEIVHPFHKTGRQVNRKKIFA